MDLPEATPSMVHDADDPGGYYLNGGIRVSMDTQPGPNFYILGVSFDENFWFAEHLCYNLWGVSCTTDVPAAQWNCSDSGGAPQYFADADFPGMINGETVCTDCCAHLIGLVKFGSDTTRNEQFDSFATNNGCSVTMPEEVYCAVTDGWHWLCIENYPTRSERLYAKACLDNFVVYMRTCSVFKAAGVFEYLKDVFEPALYLDRMSIDESFTVYAIEYQEPQRACMPYSYYYPDGASNDDGDSDSSDARALTFMTVGAGVLTVANL
jgi:hypothetical protein